MNDLEAIEARRLSEQTKLDEDRSASERNRAGQFATPRALADEIARYCRQQWERRPRPIRFLEPALGTGTFFSALTRLFRLDAIERAVGYEIDPGHVEVAQALWRPSGLDVRCGDFTDQPPDRSFNLVITNPPYVRHHHLSRAAKERLQAAVRERLGMRVSGLAGLYCYFLLLAHLWVEDGGLSAWLIPSEFLDVNYGVAVKEYLTRRVRLLCIHRYSPADVQFDEALVSSAVVVFEHAPPSGREVILSSGGTLSHPDRVVSLRPADLSPPDKWSTYLTAAGNGAGRGRPVVRFGDLFTIRRGLATGNNGFFILPRSDAQRRGLPDSCLRPILPPPRRLPERVIERDADGHPRLARQLVLIDCRSPEPEVRARWPRLWEYLEDGRRRNVHEGYLTSRRTPWYAQEDRPPPPFLCTYMGRGRNGQAPFRFLWNQSQATAHNVYLLLYPRGALRAAIKRNPALQADIFAALEGFPMKDVATGGRVYGGGLYKLEPNELANLPADWLADVLRPTVDLMKPKQLDLFSDITDSTVDQ
jgi:hypothetical protein